jgi:hypothetical protein
MTTLTALDVGVGFTPTLPWVDPGLADATGPRALEKAERGGLREKYVVCRRKVPYRLTDGTWVVNLSDLLKKIDR